MSGSIVAEQMSKLPLVILLPGLFLTCVLALIMIHWYNRRIKEEKNEPI